MPCVSVRNNHARKASVKAANIERKNNRKATQAVKKQQKVATAEAKLQARAESRTATTQAKALKAQAKSAKQTSKAATKTVRQTAKATKKAAKTRQSLEKRVLKKHQSHRTKTKSAQAKALKAQTKSAKLHARKVTQATAKATKTQAKIAAAEKRVQAKAAARAEKISKVKTQIKTSVKSIKLPKLPKPTLPKFKTSPKTAAPSVQDASRAAKISGAGVQNSFKINHAAQDYTPALKPLRRTAFMTKDDLINAESRLGSTIFGPIPAGHRREFFHDQENIWIWFESWHDEIGRPHQLTVRYEVRTSGVYKKISAGAYFKLAGDELENFRRATHAYLGLIKKYLYPHVATVKK